MNLIPYTHQSIDEEDKAALIESLGQDWVTRGPKVKAFEEKVCEYCNSKYAVLFNSGSVAIEAACYAAKINVDDEIITSPNTFVGTVSGALKYTKHLSLLDIHLETGGANFENYKNQSDRRNIFIPVHYSGIANEISKPSKRDVIIEDACQAFGALYSNGEHVGSCPSSDMTVFSFHPAKTICMGEGGMVTTNDRGYYNRLLLFRNNGIIKTAEMAPWVYEVHDLTNNYNVTEFQAALGLSQLKKVDRFLERRRALAKHYRNRLSKIDGISFLLEKCDERSAHNLFPILIDYDKLGIDRTSLIKRLREKGIGTQVHFIPLYHHPYFKKHFSFDPNHFENMEWFYSKALSFPLYSTLTIEEVDRVCRELIEVIKVKEALLIS